MRCGPNSLTLSISFFARPNHKPQTWFHELTHGTGRHRDDRPYVVTRHNPTQAQSSRDAISSSPPTLNTERNEAGQVWPSTVSTLRSGLPLDRENFPRAERRWVYGFVKVSLQVSPPLRRPGKKKTDAAVG